MPISTGAIPAGAVTAARSDKFIPEVWSDDVIASYKKKLVMANLVRKMNFVGKKGDTVHIPAPIRGQATQKAAAAAVTLNFATEGEILVAINRHFEHSRLIEDIVKVQGLPSQRRFYTDDAAYALARQVDTDLILLGRQANNGAGTAAYANAFIGSNGTTAYTSGAPNAAALTDAAIRQTIQRLDDNDIPFDDRFFTVTPGTRNVLMGINRFTEQAFVGEQGQGNTIRNGRIGDLYGVEVYVTPQCDTATGAARILLMFHRDAFVLVEQMAIRSQTQYKQEYLADLFTADTLYGTQILRKGDNADIPAAAFALAVPA